MNYKDAKELFDSLNEEVNKIRLISNPTDFQNDPAFSKLIHLREEVRKLLEIVPAHRVKTKVVTIPTLNASGKINEELSAAQKKLPPGLQKAIAAKQGDKVEEEDDKEEVVEHDDGTQHEHPHPKKPKKKQSVKQRREEPKTHLDRIWSFVKKRIGGDVSWDTYKQAADDVDFTKSMDLQALLKRVQQLTENYKVGENMEHPKSRMIEQLMPLFEQDLDQAELVLAAKDMGDRLQKMAEDLASMQVEDLMPLVAAMKEQMGPEKAGAFESSADSALSGALDAVKGAKESHDNAVLALQGEAPIETDMDMEEPAPEDMGDEMSMDEPAPEMEVDMGDEEAMAGVEGEPEGREIKAEESVQFLNKAKNILRAYKKIGKLDESALEEAKSILKGK